MTTAASLKERYDAVKGRVADAARRSGRGPSDIIVVAVTKYSEPDQIRELVQLGHVDLGENRPQQLLQRAAIIDEWVARHRILPSTPWAGGAGAAAIMGTAPAPRRPGGSRGAAVPVHETPGVRWHMIGHLQRNKVKKLIEATRLIHSVDSLRLAEEIQAAATKRDQVVDVLLQVNISGEGSKSGCAVAAALHLAEQIETMVQLRVRGLMTMAPFGEDPEGARPIFARCRELFEELLHAGIGQSDVPVSEGGPASGRHFNILSMGMSNDFEVAIEEGSNLVRIGSAIFGEHTQGDDGSDDEPRESSGD